MLTTRSDPPCRRRRPPRWLLPDDGIIDELAVRIAASGARRVALTMPEREAAAALMITRGADTAELAANLGTTTIEAARLVALLGYRLSARDRGTGHRWILPA